MDAVEQPAEMLTPTAAVELPASEAQSDLDLQKMAQCVLAGGFAAAAANPEQLDPQLLDTVIYQLYTLVPDERYEPSTEERELYQNSKNLYRLSSDNLAPVLQDLFDSSKRLEDGVWFSAPGVYELYTSIVPCDLSEAEFMEQAAAADGEFEMRDGGFVHPLYEASYGDIYYADRLPFPHSGDSTYRFRILCGTAGGWHELYDITFEQAPESSFGVRIVGVENLTAAYGDEVEEMARDYSVHRDGFVFPESSTRLLTQEDRDSLVFDDGLEMYSEKYALAFARNELFARHGNIFDTPAYADFFSQFDWYVPSHKVETSEFNEIERANLDQIIAWETEAKEY
ncbi:MAG: YARHG domain-containing protein [Clostridia bacterium]|nr:YARHG domain-containing protein [Clostridia bacterium]